MAPAIGQLEAPVRTQQRKIAGIPVHVHDPLAPRGKEILGHLPGAGGFQQKGRDLRAHYHPKPPVLPRLALRQTEHRPARFIHLPMGSPPALQDKLPGQRLDHFLDLVQPTGERPRRHFQAVGLEFLYRPVQGRRPRELLQQHLHPETDREEPFGNQLGRLGRAPQTPAWGHRNRDHNGDARVGGAQVHLPFDLLTLLRQARGGPKLAADRAGALPLAQGVMGGLFGQMQTPVPFGAWAARLLPPAAWGRSRSPSPNRLRPRWDPLGRSDRRARFGRSLR